MFSLPGLIVLRTLAERQGVTDQNALNKVSLIGGMAGLSPVGIIVGKTLIDREVEAATPAPSGAGATTTAVQFAVPRVKGQQFKAAQQELTAEPFKFTVTRINVVNPASKATEEEVIKQSPTADESLPAGSNVTLWVNVPEVPAVGGPRLQDAVVHITTALEELKSVPTA
jgi:hypothetical protein